MKRSFKIAHRFGLLMMFAAAFALIWPTHAHALARKKGWLGVVVQELTPTLKRTLKVGDRTGLLISEVIEDSPAEEAGLEEEDVILEFDGKPVERVRELSRMVRRIEPGTKVKILLLRDGKEKEVEVTIGKLHRGKPFTIAYDDNVIRFIGGRPGLGVQVYDLNENLASYFGVKKHEGVLILEVLEDTPAEKAGLQSGDIITKIDGEKIRDAEDLVDLMEDYEEGDEVTVEYIRHGDRKTVKVELETVRAFPKSFFVPDWPRIYMQHMFPGRKHMMIIGLPRIRARLEAIRERLLRMKEFQQKRINPAIPLLYRQKQLFI